VNALFVIDPNTSSLSGLVLADRQVQTIPVNLGSDGQLGTRVAVLQTGDFNGDGTGDVFVTARPELAQLLGLNDLDTVIVGLTGSSGVQELPGVNPLAGWRPLINFR
jgi:hypothetical protein